MQYTNDIVINIPLKKVILLFENPENMSKWQPELISFEHISGEPGKEDAKSRLKYKMGKREIEMIETITKNNLPVQFDGTYVAKGVFNEISNRFIAVSENKTKWISHNIFKFSGFMKIIGILMPGSFSKQSCRYMEQFKEFAENNNF